MGIKAYNALFFHKKHLGRIGRGGSQLESRQKIMNLGFLHGLPELFPIIPERSDLGSKIRLIRHTVL